ncbi:MAG: adenylate/guanylate cyclase domain-containing protein [Proteobacteria bacterium]|nr:adenylate/guanylate cyclase domain-containing protein [Pseudomonadota bacterium]MBU1741731.1 adenylate/guanylate cyclase domain-containing protein [Pseudomonadota bacterium]
MTDQGYRRRLSALLSADVEGYSRLMRDDEEATIRTVTTFRAAITNLVQQYRGRVVDSPGDNILAEFTSVVDAVNGAVEIQRELAERNLELPENRRMNWRIGINLGDVIEDGERIYGDGVNVAARMEGLAEGGGICLSGTVFDAIENKVGLEYEFLGEQTVKNIPKPIRAYRVLSYPGAAAHRVLKAKRAVGHKWRKIGLAAAMAAAVAAVVVVWYCWLRSPSIKPVAKKPPAAKAQALPLPDKPSIVVLPFVNMTGDPKQEYFSDGMTEAITRGLSRVPKLFVIARNSAFVYKGKAVKVQQVGRDLGVRYVLEGSVQRSANRVRITAQLIDARTGRHLWSQKYDRPLKDIFALQDEITMKIMTAMQINLTEGEQARLRAERASTQNLEAYELYLQGVAHIRRSNKAANAVGRKLLQRAIKLDPKFSAAYGWLGFAHLYDFMWGWTKDRRASLMSAARYARQALALNPRQDVALFALGAIYLLARRYDKALATLERAVALNPNSADAWLGLAMFNYYLSNYRRALAAINRALRLNPFPTPLYYHILGMVRRGLGQYHQAIVAYKKALALNPRFQFAYYGLVRSYVRLGRLAEARAALAGLLRINPDFSMTTVNRLPYKDPAMKKAAIEAFKKARLKK